jgi:2'-5' RNA ligase
VLAVGGRTIPARNLHVTLAFLGTVPEERIEKIIALAGLVGRCGAIDLAFDRLEVWKRSRVLVIVPRILPSALKELAEQLHFNLLNEHFEVGHEEYRPHLTIARDARRALELDLATPIRCRFERFSLVESKNTSNGSIYRNLHNWELIQ